MTWVIVIDRTASTWKYWWQSKTARRWRSPLG